MTDLQQYAIQLAWEVQLRQKNLVLDWDGQIRPYKAGFKGIVLRAEDTAQTIYSKLQTLVASKQDGPRIKTSLERYL